MVYFIVYEYLGVYSKQLDGECSGVPHPRSLCVQFVRVAHYLRSTVCEKCYGICNKCYLRFRVWII